MPKWISVTWSEEVTDSESQTLTRTIAQTLTRLYLHNPVALADPPIQVRTFGNWVIPALGRDHPYWGAQWYIDASYDENVQRVIAPVFLELVRQEPWQRADPHFDLALLAQDLTDFPTPLARLRPERYTLGASFPGTAAVMSVYRLRAIAGDEPQRLALARLVRHHMGHVLGAPSLTRKEQVRRLGLEMHCTSPVCAMRHASTVDECVEMAYEEAQSGWPFCDLCTSDLHSTITRYALVWS